MDQDFKFKQIVESAHDVIVITKSNSTNILEQEIVYVNPAFTELTGYSYDDAVGKQAKLLELFPDELTKKEVRSAIEHKTPVRTKIHIKNKADKECSLDLIMMPLKDSRGDLTYFASIERDVTTEEELLSELERLSRTDPLTGLINRRALHDVAEVELSRYKRGGIAFCLIALDLDFFKSINDTYGHAAGDKILQAVSEVLKKQDRPYDFAARIGGEEFCILISNACLMDACGFAERVRKAISEIEIVDQGKLIHVTTSIGIAEVNKSDIDMDSILKRADQALYKAKETGRNCVCKYEENIN